MHRIIPPHLEAQNNPLLVTNNDIEMYNLMMSLMLDMNNSRPIQMINRHYLELRNWIMLMTPKLSEQEIINSNEFKFDMSTRCRWIMSGRSDFPICRFCHQQFGLTRNLPIRYDYSEWCSNKCRQTDPLIVARTKATKLKNHGDENYCNPEKAKQTFLVNYGVSNPNKCRSTREKIEQTCLDTYGYKNAIQAPKVKEKIKHTNLERRGVASPLADPEVREKGKQTSWRVYGTEFPMQSDIVKHHLKESFIDHYGIDHNMKSEEGLLYWQQCFKAKYGVDNPSKCPQIRELIRRKYIYDNIQFDSAPEIAFYIWLKDMNIPFEYQPKSSFIYEYAEKQHSYFPDFKIDDMYFEIKGDQFFNLDGTMTCPFRRKNMSDEEYTIICELFEAKHQCMLKNDVIILRHAEYCMFLCYVSQTYGKDYLKQFRVNKKKDN